MMEIVSSQFVHDRVSFIEPCPNFTAKYFIWLTIGVQWDCFGAKDSDRAVLRRGEEGWG